MSFLYSMSFFFFNDTATTEIYTLSLHDALPIYRHRSHTQGPGSVTDGTGPLRVALSGGRRPAGSAAATGRRPARSRTPRDRKSTRLNSSHANISYAVFCLKKKKISAKVIHQS